MIEPEWRVSPLLLGSLASWPEIPRQPHLPSSCDQCPASDFNDSTFLPRSFTHSRLPLPMGTISVGGTSVLIVPKLGQRIMHIRSLIRTSHELYFYHSPCCAVYLRICIWVSVYFHAPLDLPQPKLCIVRPSSAELSCGSSSELWANVRQPGCRHLQVFDSCGQFLWRFVFDFHQFDICFNTDQSRKCQNLPSVWFFKTAGFDCKFGQSQTSGLLDRLTALSPSPAFLFAWLPKHTPLSGKSKYFNASKIVLAHLRFVFENQGYG